MLGKLRGGAAALVTVGMSVPSPAMRVEAQVTAFHGIGWGTGRIRGVDIDVRMESKTARGHTVVTVGERPRLSVVS